MKKNKSEEQSSAEFKNHPFKSLKGFAPTPAPAKNKTATAPVREKTKHEREDDASLFLRAVDGAKRMDPAPGSSAPAVKHKDSEKTAAGEPEDKKLFLQAMRTMGATLRDDTLEREPEEPGSRIQTGRMRQLKRGTIRISQELDLHGFLKDEAVKRLEHFIVDAFSQGQKAVLVITGKGINSPEGPVLQGAASEWLRQQGRGMVAEFYPAPRDRGGSGAFVVFLKDK